MYVQQGTCQNHISIWHGVHMALATTIKVFVLYGIACDKYDKKLEFVTPLKYNWTYDVCALNNKCNSSLIYLITIYSMKSYLSIQSSNLFPTKRTNLFSKVVPSHKIIRKYV